MPDKGDPGFTLASLLILAVLGMFAWNSAPLRSARPGGDKEEAVEHRYDDQVPARLWQDPFNAVHRHERALAALGAAGAKKKRSLPADIEDVLEENGKEMPGLTVLVPMLTPGSYAEIEERRRRWRYAILAALGDSGFVPRSAESLGLFHLRPKCEKVAGERPDAFQVEATRCERSEGDLPYEWYDYEDPVSGQLAKRSVLLLWLDESWLGNEPFERIGALVEQVLSLPVNRSHVSWVMIGPSSSGTLRSMVRRKKETAAIEKLRTRSGLDSFYILSPVATVDDCDLDRTLPYCDTTPSCETAPHGPDGRDSAAPSDLLGEYFTEKYPCRSEDGETCMRFLRTIRSDKDLIAELGKELKRRGVKANDPIIALSEWDTYFGRSIPRSLYGVLTKGTDHPNLRRYTYERGIDGIALGEEMAQPQSQPRGNPGPTGSDITMIRRPLGTGQFDYLRRLAETIRDDDEASRIEKGRGIKAVAVLGSDVFDKLLIMRALRDDLPGAIWVTTDLDANLLHPEEFSWARNVIVASTYDLRLPPPEEPSPLLSSSPPFRDSYQTSTYLAVRMAVSEEFVADHWCPGLDLGPNEPFPGQRAMYESLPPLLFEVGRNGVVRLKGEPVELHRCRNGNREPPITYETAPPRVAYFVGGVLLAVLGIVALHQVRPRSGRIVLVLSALLLAVVALLVVALATAAGGEPLDLQAGVSVWPTIIIRLFLMALILGFIWTSLRSLERNWKDLNHRYFGGPEAPSDNGLTLREAWQRGWTRGRHLRPWVVGCLFLLGALIFAMQVPRLRSAPALWTLARQALIFAVLITFWWLFMYGKLRFDVRVRSINRWMNQKHGGSAITLWRRYRQYGEIQHRMLRSAGVTLLYFAFGSIIFLLLGGGNAPCRGPVACRLNGFTLGLSVVLMLFLLFLIVDAIRLCVCWIEKLRDPNLQWTGALIHDLARKRQLPEGHAVCWLQVHLIGERTREVSRLLYYPLIVILLLLLSRSRYFDNWDFPIALAIVIGINFLIALVAAAKLNLSARLAREEILERLRDESLELAKETQTEIPTATPNEIDHLIEKLSKLKLGAYQRVWEQPLVRAIILLLSGLGLTFTEYARFLN